ncbi:unnamed protein product [Heligmosomoides polygyrus]|uniref:Phosphatidylserine decarboxylase n=1 Tax=Heligmosomoides polygyrus TaxID=6339 RepID=A0A183FX72_HELPZ|nr:unnamed protein product [Heligmosomoides polygyrus]
MSAHPWAGFITISHALPPLRAECMTSDLPLEFYRHIPESGYMSSKFVRSLFPHNFRQLACRQTPYPFLELMRLEHAVRFRAATQTVIDDLFHQPDYREERNTRPETPANSLPSTVVPRVLPHFPVLYQVVSKGHGLGVILEAKDFFIIGPDRPELHCVVLDQFATNVESNTRGFNRSLLSVKDFVWVYSLLPTRAAIARPLETLARSRRHRITALDTQVLLPSL